MTDKQLNRFSIIFFGSLLILFIILMSSCNRKVAISKGETKTETVIDTVHVIKYDTTITTHEVNQYQTKTVELYDTVITAKDSIITVLKSRTILTNGIQQKDEVKKGVGSDSAAGTTKVKTEIVYKDKIIEKKSLSLWWLLVSFLLGGVLAFFFFNSPPGKIINEAEAAWNAAKFKALGKK